MVIRHRRIVPGMILALTLLGASGLAHAASSGTGKERRSAAGQVQTGAMRATPPSGARMNPDRPPAAEPVDGTVQDMATALAQQKGEGATAGDVQPKVEPGTAAAPPGGTGEQQAAPPAANPQAAAASSPKHLRVLLRVTRAGAAEVVASTEVPGEAVPSEAPIGQYLVQIQKGNQTVTVQAVTDPFEMRSYAPRDQPELGHHVEEAREALISVDLPNTTLASPDLETTAVRVYRIKPGTTVEKIDTATFKRLESAGRLEKTVDTSGTPVGRQMREKGTKLAE